MVDITEERMGRGEFRGKREYSWEKKNFVEVGRRNWKNKNAVTGATQKKENLAKKEG